MHKQQSTLQTIIFISIVVVVVAALLLGIGATNKVVTTPSSTQVNNIPPPPRPDTAALKKTKAEILALASKPKLTAAEKSVLFGYISGEKFNYYGFSASEQKLVIGALSK